MATPREELDRHVEAFFEEMGDKTDGYLAFLRNENAGEQVGFADMEATLLDPDRLARFAKKVQEL